jgi:hypothetical protein
LLSILCKIVGKARRSCGFAAAVITRNDQLGG